jgi:hypothetical protein
LGGLVSTSLLEELARKLVSSFREVGEWNGEKVGRFFGGCHELKPTPKLSLLFLLVLDTEPRRRGCFQPFLSDRPPALLTLPISSSVESFQRCVDLLRPIPEGSQHRPFRFARHGFGRNVGRMLVKRAELAEACPLVLIEPDFFSDVSGCLREPHFLVFEVSSNSLLVQRDLPDLVTYQKQTDP